MSELKETLTERGITFELLPHAKAYTSIEEARALGIDADEVVKTIVLDTQDGHAVAVIPASRRLNMNLVRDALADNHAALATENEIEQDFPGYELGALPPLGTLLHAPVFVDPEVMTHETIVFAAGSQTESVKARTKDVFRGENVREVPLTQHPDEKRGWG
jgi:Ala-tRNA(Pro) deacylase